MTDATSTVLVRPSSHRSVRSFRSDPVGVGGAEPRAASRRGDA